MCYLFLFIFRYESLYDVLNQAFITMGSEKLLRIAVGKRSQPCPVHDDFRIIAVAEQDHAYQQLDLPLLNRLEKQLLRHSDVCRSVPGTPVFRVVSTMQYISRRVAMI